MKDLNSEIKFNRTKFRVDHFDMVVSDYILRKERDELILNPPYQRKFRWDIESQSALIESLLIGIPLPPIFVLQNNETKWEIIDGLQRTSTLINFLSEDSKAVFKGCEILKKLNGKTFKELPDNVQRLVNNTRIRIEIIEETDDIFSQYLLFNRLNSNGEKLSAQEIRNFLIYKLNSDFYYKIKDLAEDEEILKILGLYEKQSKKEKKTKKEESVDRQENVEYVLRFFLGREFARENKIEKYDMIATLITDETERYLKKYSNDFLEQEYEIFRNSFKLIQNVFGDNSFRYFKKNSKSLTNTFSMIIGISFILDELDKVNDKNNFIKITTEKYFSSDSYKKLTRSSYSPTKRFFEINHLSKEFYQEALRSYETSIKS